LPQILLPTDKIDTIYPASPHSIAYYQGLFPLLAETLKKSTEYYQKDLMHPVQLQLLPQPGQTPPIIPVSQTLPQPGHIQIQSPPPNLGKNHSVFQQTPLISPPSSSTSPSSGSAMSTSGSNGGSNNSHGSNSIANSNILDDDKKMRDKCLYLKQLLQDKKQIQGLSGYFLHVDRILDEGENAMFSGLNLY